MGVVAQVHEIVRCEKEKEKKKKKKEKKEKEWKKEEI